MKIIISPAKKMNVNTDLLAYRNLPIFINEAEKLMHWIQGMTFEEMKNLWMCNDKIAEQNARRFREMDLRNQLTPAILSYEGIQYQYLAPAVLDVDAMEYLQAHLRILSGFYGVLKPFDGVTPYRLEMQAKEKNLYEFWGDRLYREVMDDAHVIINLASKEYAKCMEKYIQPEERWITCVFGELANGKVKQKGTMAKMARGEMVRYMAERQIKEPEQIKEFDRLGYVYNKEHSSEETYVFLKEES